ncbi:MAG: hypothetical protein Q8R72_00530 [Hylemonella sp.]|nr:hypothetical protein [Hylemonella sp.]
MKLRFLALLLLALGLSVHAADQAGKTSRVPKPVIEAAKGGQCVEPADDMRRNHMKYLQHQRDDTVHGGIRGARHSLKACIECHASPATNSVTAAPTNFCISCHSYTAVKVDCFGCHATQPAKGATSFHPLVHPTGATAALSRQMRQLASPHKQP